MPARPRSADTIPGTRRAEQRQRANVDPARWLERFGRVEVRRAR